MYTVQTLLELCSKKNCCECSDDAIRKATGKKISGDYYEIIDCQSKTNLRIWTYDEYSERCKLINKNKLD